MCNDLGILAERLEMGRLLTTNQVVDYYTSPGLIVRGGVQMSGMSIKKAAEYQELYPEALRAYIETLNNGWVSKLP